MSTAGFPEPPPVNSAPVKRPQAKIWLETQPGKRPGHAIIQEVGGLVITIRFPAAQYAVIYALAEQNRKDVDLPNWKSRGFLTKEQLQQRLTEFEAKSPWHATKHIFRARKTLSQIGQVGDQDGWAWAHEFLETSDLDSYRLSISPEHVFID